MATIKIEKFCGLQPRVNAAMLADDMATIAHNCRLKSGKLVPLMEPSVVTGAPVRYENGLADIKDAKSIHAWKLTAEDGSTSIDFLLFPGVVWFAGGNIGDDPNDRVFVSGDTGMPFTDTTATPHRVYANAPCLYLHNRGANSFTRHVLCKNPLGHLNVSRNRSKSGDLDTNKDVRFTFLFATWVDALGSESGLSAPSFAKNGSEAEYTEQTLEYNDGDYVSVDAITGIPNEAVAVRIWKVVSGSESQAIQFVHEVSTEAAAIGFDFRVLDENAGEVIPQFESPPGDLRCITRVPGNFYAGVIASAPKTVAFCEIDMPTSWPFDYRYDVEDNVVCIAATTNTLFALTDGKVYTLTGTAPESMAVAKLADSAACVSARSAVVVGASVYYASNDGLYMVYSDSDYGLLCKNITEKFLTREQWEDLGPSSCVAQATESEIHLFFAKEEGGRVVRRNLNVNLLETRCALSTSDEVASCACVDPRTGKMYYVRIGEE